MRSRAQRIAGSAAAVAAALLVASVALAAPPGVSWSVSRQPGSVTAGVPTLVTVTVTNTSTTSEQIACIRINVPVAFAVVSASITSTPSGRKWSASVVGSTVTARAQNGGSTLRGGTDRDRVGIGVTVSGLVPGSHAWSAAAYGDTTCQKSMDLTASFNVTVTVLATPAPTPAPTPPPTPRPTPTPTPRPTPTPTPTATPSTPAAPSADPVRSDDPASPTPEPSPGRPDPTGDPGGPGPGPTAGATPSPSPTLAAAWAGRTPDRFEIRLRDSAAIRVDLSASLDAGSLAIQWGVPAIALSVPGLLVIGVVLAQTAGGLVWLPLVRRWVGAFGIWRRRRDGARPRR